MSQKIDLEWYNTKTKLLKYFMNKNDSKLKNMGGLIERPALGPAFTPYRQMSFKVLLIGKANSGKTKFLNGLLRKSENCFPLIQTPGTLITELNWPVKFLNQNDFIVLKLNIWDVGNYLMRKNEKIQSVRTKLIRFIFLFEKYIKTILMFLKTSLESVDCFCLVFSFKDRKSFIEVFNTVDQLNKSSDRTQKLILGTR
jgi:hypothetical protein